MLKAGDRVKLKQHTLLSNRFLSASNHGVVLHVDREKDEFEVSVQFDEPIEQGHNCFNRNRICGKDGHCLFVHSNLLEKVEEVIRYKNRIEIRL